MKCPRCQHENPPLARFCLGCGVRLALACSACRTDLPGGAQFCPQCGQAVAAGNTAAGSSPAPKSCTPEHLAERILTSKAALEVERKQVTALCADSADLKGSKELLTDRDPEEARKILHPMLEFMMNAVHRYEGTVNQMTATRLMLSFLAIASFAPVAVGLRPGRWAAYYYGALFVWWISMSVVIMRLATPERPDGGVKPRARRDSWKARQGSATRSGNKPLIIVVSEQADLYSRISRKHWGDDSVRVMIDRRSADRRRNLEVYIPDRRRAERRRVDIAPLLRTRGWAEVRLRES